MYEILNSEQRFYKQVTDQAYTPRPCTFIGGAMQHLSAAGAIGDSMSSLILVLVNFFSAAGYQTHSAHLIEDFGRKTGQWTPSQVAQRDFRWMQECDFFVALLPSTDKDGVMRTDGTHIELGWASALNKPVLLVAQNPMPDTYSHLVRGLKALTQVEILDFKKVAQNPHIVMDAVHKLHCNALSIERE